MDAIHPIAALALTECIPAKQLKLLKARIEEGSNIGFELTAKLSGRLTRGEPTRVMPTASTWRVSRRRFA